MKLRSLELEQFRKFDRAVQIDRLSDGVNVLCGPNEFGKSTILAAIRGLLFERHNSKAESIKSMQNVRGNAGPRLAMTFEVGAGLWRLEKRFLHRPMALLTAPDGARFEGEAAEEELQRLMSFGAAGKQGARSEHMGVWAALWVTQRESVSQADLSSHLAHATITSCLDAEVGVLTGSEKGQAIMRVAREQLGQLLDGNGKPKGRYKQVIVAIGESDGKLAELRDRAQRLSEDSKALRDSREQLARESDPEAEQRDRTTLEDARGRKEAALVYEQRLEVAGSVVNLAEQHRNDALGESRSRNKRAEDMHAAEQQSAAVERSRQGAEHAANESAAQQQECRAQVETAQSWASETTRARSCAQRVTEVLKRVATLAAQERALGHAEKAQSEVNALLARLEAMPVDQVRIDCIRKAARETEAAESALQAQATEVELDLLPTSNGRVEVAGAAAPPGPQLLRVIAETEIRIADVGRIVVRPVIRDRDKLVKRLSKAREGLALALAELGCKDADAAETCFTEREAVAGELNEARAGLARAAPGDEATGLLAGAGALRDRVDVLRLRLEEDRSALGLDVLPSPDAAATMARQAQEEENAAKEAQDKAQVDWNTATSAGSDAREALAKAAAEAAAANQAVARLRRESADAEAREPSDALVLRLAQAEELLARRSVELAQLERDRPADTPAAMEARIKRYEQAIQGRQQAVGQLREHIRELRTRIAQEGGHGLDEQIAAADRGHEALATEQAGYARDAKVLKLLLDTLSKAEHEAKEKYLAPVTRRVTPYLRNLFPGAEIVCDEAWRITALARNGLGAEDFQKLSDGTQEQIAVLARLAFAGMLIDQGRPAMVILDDALAYSDPERIERMFDVLTQASSKMQILILTCRTDVFARLGGHRVELKWPDAAVRV